MYLCVHKKHIFVTHLNFTTHIHYTIQQGTTHVHIIKMIIQSSYSTYIYIIYISTLF